MKWKKGSFMIEASLLMPLVIAVIMFVAYLSFYLFNQVFLSQSAYIAALRGSQWQNYGNTDVGSRAQQEGRKLLQVRLLSAGTIQEEIEVTAAEIRVRYRVYMRNPFQKFIQLIMKQSEWIVETDRYAKRINPVSFIRSCRKAASLP